jgi:hypothetical protein
MTSKDPLEDADAVRRRAEKNRRADVAAMAREIARELHRLQMLEDIPADDQTAPAFRPATADLVTGGRDQCIHGVPNGRMLRPDIGTPACSLCRLQYLESIQDPK